LAAGESLDVVVLGGRGMLGRDLVCALRADSAFGRVEVADLPEVDITQPDALAEYVGSVRPALVVNCAAYTDVDGCERNPERAHVVNAVGAANVAVAAAAAGAHLVHISTDFVFDGLKGESYVEDDPPAPLSVYGRSKLEGERLVAAAGGRWTVVRTAWLYGRHGDNFVDTVLRRAQEGRELMGVIDQVGSPTWTRDLALALIAVVKRGARGFLHAANEGLCSRYEQMRHILDCAGVKIEVRPVDSSAFPRPARVPANSALSSAKLRAVTGHAMRHWRDALREYVQSGSKPTPRETSRNV